MIFDDFGEYFSSPNLRDGSFYKAADGLARIKQLTGQYSFDPQRVEVYLNRLEVLQDRTYKQKFGGFWRYVFDCICLLPPLIDI